MKSITSLSSPRIDLRSTANSFRKTNQDYFKSEKSVYFGDFNKKNKKVQKNKICVKIDKEFGEQELREKLSKLKNEEEHLDLLLRQNEEKSKKYVEILNLINENIEELKLNNEENEYLRQTNLTQRNVLQKEQRHIADYCNKIKSKFYNTVEIVKILFFLIFR